MATTSFKGLSESLNENSLELWHSCWCSNLQELGLLWNILISSVGIFGLYVIFAADHRVSLEHLTAYISNICVVYRWIVVFCSV